MTEISDAAKKAADWVFEQVEIYNELGRNECRERIHNACEEYARNLSDYKAKQIAEKDAEIERLRDAIMCISVMAANQHEDIYDYATFILYDEKALAGGEGDG